MQIFVAFALFGAVFVGVEAKKEGKYSKDANDIKYDDVGSHFKTKMLASIYEKMARNAFKDDKDTLKKVFLYFLLLIDHVFLLLFYD